MRHGHALSYEIWPATDWEAGYTILLRRNVPKARPLSFAVASLQKSVLFKVPSLALRFSEEISAPFASGTLPCLSWLCAPSTAV